MLETMLYLLIFVAGAVALVTFVAGAPPRIPLAIPHRSFGRSN